MAVQLEFVNLIVPIARIRELYPGGWTRCLEDHARSIGRVSWHDLNLFRASGSMAPELTDVLVAKWVDRGFTSTELVDGETVWKDFCVVDSFGFSRYRCHWLEFDPASRSAWLTGTQPGEPISRDHFR